jgi:DNA-3-methyladenine glycosylase II
MRQRKSDTLQTAKPLRQERGRTPSDPLRADQKREAKKPSRATKVQTKRRSRRRDESTAARVYHPGPAIDSEAALGAGLAALGERDRELVAHLLAVAGPPPLRARPPGLEGLVWIIVSQQLSTASATAIFARFKARFPDFEAAAILAASDDRLRGCGLSAAKVRTLRALCETIGAGRLDLERLAGLDASEAHRALVAVKGIGPWTADIFLLFCLGHPDAWPAGDLALQEAARIALGLEQRPNAAKLAAIGERWRPWRGVAARLLWAYYRAVKGRAGLALAT